MIIARAPVRISFGGGGTDLAAYYDAFGGYVVSAAITRYCRVVAREPADGMIRISSADYGVDEELEPGQPPEPMGALTLPRAALAHFWSQGLAERGVELSLAADVPPGTGLGSSSAMAVALVLALSTYCGVSLDSHTAADLACRLEIERLGMPIGRQDQYASAFGGVNELRFSTAGVEVQALGLEPAVAEAFGVRLLLFTTGLRRHSASILRRQQSDSAVNPHTIAALHRVKALAQEMRAALLAGELDDFGRLLDLGWREKRRLAGGISSAAIDGWYECAREAGALGGKITGAGGGGFLLLYCLPQRQETLRAALAGCGLKELSFDFDLAGAHVHEQPEAREIGAYFNTEARGHRAFKRSF